MAALVVLGTVVSVGGIDDGTPSVDVATTSGFDLATPASPDADAAESRVGAGEPNPVDEQNASGDADPVPLSCVVTQPEGLVWRLAFVDDFAGPGVDTDNWYLYDSPGNAGFGLRRPSAIATRDGMLVITASMVDGALVSGGMAHRTDQIYGRWEFRVRTDPDPSEATSGVVLTWPGSDNWPIDGENDMYETERDPDRTPFRTFIHYGADNSQEFLTHEADGTEWHDMVMEWTADRIALYRDGQYVGEINDPAVIPDVPHHMTIQLDAWTDSMGDPVEMEVDWVRVYSYDPAATSC